MYVCWEYIREGGSGEVDDVFHHVHDLLVLYSVVLGLLLPLEELGIKTGHLCQLGVVIPVLFLEQFFVCV